MTKQDWTLLAIAAAEGEALSPVQLQKVLFLFGELKLPRKQRRQFYEFVPYNYGPFDPAVYRDAEALQEAGLVEIGRTSRWNTYSATPEGLLAAGDLGGRGDAASIDYLRKLVEWARALSFQELVREVYARFPQYRVNSVFQD